MIDPSNAVCLIFLLLRSLEGNEASIVACAFSPDGTYIVTGSNNGDLRIWDAKYGHGKYLVQELDGHDLGVTCVEFSPTYGSASKYQISNDEDLIEFEFHLQ